MRVGSTAVDLGTVNNGSATTLTAVEQLVTMLDGDLRVTDGGTSPTTGIDLVLGTASADKPTRVQAAPTHQRLYTALAATTQLAAVAALTMTR
jgi:hypothetical protein